MFHVVVFVACQEDGDFQFNKSELSVLEKYVKKLVQKEVNAQMKELKNAEKIQDEAINALQSQIRSERQYRKELETRLKALDRQQDYSQRIVVLKLWGKTVKGKKQSSVNLKLIALL